MFCVMVCFIVSVVWMVVDGFWNVVIGVGILESVILLFWCRMKLDSCVVCWFFFVDCVWKKVVKSGKF